MATYRLISPTYTERLDRRFHVDVAYTVVKRADGSYFNVAGYKPDDLQWAGAQAIYLGGRDGNYVDSVEAGLLTAAGYTIEVT